MHPTKLRIRNRFALTDECDMRNWRHPKFSLPPPPPSPLHQLYVLYTVCQYYRLTSLRHCNSCEIIISCGKSMSQSSTTYSPTLVLSSVACSSSPTLYRHGIDAALNYHTHRWSSYFISFIKAKLKLTIRA